jgi:hypothetical protein
VASRRGARAARSRGAKVAEHLLEIAACSLISRQRREGAVVARQTSVVVQVGIARPIDAQFDGGRFKSTAR